MKCPYCNALDTKVLDKRETEDSEATRRRRECLECGKRFTTYERIDAVDLFIVKKDGRREQFDRNKLKTGIMRACEKRPVSADEVDKIIAEIETKVRALDSTEIQSSVIGEMVMKKLRSLDKVAYIRFASVYRDFTDLETFRSEVEKLLNK
jgi:transcriptional repressor NrdR